MGNNAPADKLARLKMPFGRHRGQSLARIALTNYPADGRGHAQTGYEYLFGWLKPTVNLSAHLSRGLDRIELALNGYKPVVDCNSCGKDASNFAILYSQGGYEPTDQGYFCSDLNCRPTSDSHYEFVFKPLRFDTVLEFSNIPKKFVLGEVRPFIYNRLLTAAGTKDRDFTDEYAARFIEGLIAPSAPVETAAPANEALPISEQLKLFSS